MFPFLFHALVPVFICFLIVDLSVSSIMNVIHFSNWNNSNKYSFLAEYLICNCLLVWGREEQWEGEGGGDKKMGEELDWREEIIVSLSYLLGFNQRQ